MTKPTQDQAERAVRTLLDFIDDDPAREGLEDTPARVVKSYAEIFAGYTQDPAAVLGTTFGECESYSQMILLTGIKLQSTCEHHMLPFNGEAAVAYIPRERVVGISKLARLVEVYSRRLQIQEKLTEQVADALHEHLDPLGVGVLMKAHHACMGCRGVRHENARMTTTALRGEFLTDAAVRAEFLSAALSHK